MPLKYLTSQMSKSFTSCLNVDESHPKFIVKENLETTNVRNASNPKPVGADNINPLYLFHLSSFYSNTPFIKLLRQTKGSIKLGKLWI